MNSRRVRCYIVSCCEPFACFGDEDLYSMNNRQSRDNALLRRVHVASKKVSLLDQAFAFAVLASRESAIIYAVIAISPCHLASQGVAACFGHYRLLNLPGTGFYWQSSRGGRARKYMRFFKKSEVKSSSPVWHANSRSLGSKLMTCLLRSWDGRIGCVVRFPLLFL